MAPDAPTSNTSSQSAPSPEASTLSHGGSAARATHSQQRNRRCCCTAAAPQAAAPQSLHCCSNHASARTRCSLQQPDSAQLLRQGFNKHVIVGQPDQRCLELVALRLMGDEAERRLRRRQRRGRAGGTTRWRRGAARAAFAMRAGADRGCEAERETATLQAAAARDASAGGGNTPATARCSPAQQLVERATAAAAAARRGAVGRWCGSRRRRRLNRCCWLLCGGCLLALRLFKECRRQQQPAGGCRCSCWRAPRLRRRARAVGHWRMRQRRRQRRRLRRALRDRGLLLRCLEEAVQAASAAAWLRRLLRAQQSTAERRSGMQARVRRVHI